MSDEKVFWMVYVKSSLSNHIQYTNKEDAQKEAERLARSTGQTVYIMYAVEGYKTLVSPVVSFPTIAF